MTPRPARCAQRAGRPARPSVSVPFATVFLLGKQWVRP